MTEAEANEVRDAILSGWITTGPRVKKLEKVIANYLGLHDGSEGTPTPNCVCLGSQTACGEMALRLLGIGPDDEVIVPAYTYTASASVVAHMGAKIVFVDVAEDKKNSDNNDGNTCYSIQMDYSKLADAITERTKVVMAVDLCGIPCDFDRILEVVESKKALFRPANDIQKKMGRVAIVADAAHAFGAKRKVNDKNSEVIEKMVGAIADFTGFSFHAVKNFTTAEGGAMTWNLPFGDEEVERQQIYYGSPVPEIPGETWNSLLYRLAQLFSLHGQNKDALAKTRLGAWEYDIIGPWYKCNMTDIMAAIGLIQFGRYPEMLEKRRKFIAIYDKAIEGYNSSESANKLKLAHLNHYNDDYQSSGHLYLVRLMGKTREEVNEIIEKMAERGISTNVHYKPLPMMTAYKAMGADINDYPNAYSLFENEITLPLFTKMTEDDVNYIIENFLDIVKGM